MFCCLLLVAALGAGCDGDDDDQTATMPAEVDAVIEGIESGDVNQIVSEAHFVSLACTEELGAGGPPKCELGDSEGTPKDVFEFYSCEIDWRTEATLSDALERVTELSPQPYAVFPLPPDYEPGGHFRDPSAAAEADYVAVLEGRDQVDGFPGRGIAIGIDAAGRVGFVIMACGAGEGGGSLVPTGQSDFILPPPE
jgi:hypothetical protein